ncbi:MAG: hypothetical protein Ct9H90mP25_5400 [Gammaproteobacteria bacterium]|nr:MAG: hypothetical protein Ct9H90mP25_5400 [Gammaproteobacteria bacterium]
MFLPEEDRYSLSKQHLLSQICSLYGGRIAEGDDPREKKGVTTGASNESRERLRWPKNGYKVGVIR